MSESCDLGALVGAEEAREEADKEEEEDELDAVVVAAVAEDSGFTESESSCSFSTASYTYKG